MIWGTGKWKGEKEVIEEGGVKDSASISGLCLSLNGTAILGNMKHQV